ncbi:unnamed protein product [Protopolystoma xenopodis]|uniref:Uncharacterized protein n=1 Tax=Protopolystoma xenopodis TaxID=117903 RepID=A0A448X266_9PLAT|nr:unnamed protein product [Protopolystoma xenopodis]
MAGIIEDIWEPGIIKEKFCKIATDLANVNEQVQIVNDPELNSPSSSYTIHDRGIVEDNQALDKEIARNGTLADKMCESLEETSSFTDKNAGIRKLTNIQTTSTSANNDLAERKTDSVNESIINEQTLLGFGELQLRNSPWWVAEWDKDGLLSSRHFISRLLARKFLLGWELIASTCIYRGPYDKCVLLLRSKEAS